MHKECEESLTHTVWCYTSHTLKHDAKRRKQHSAIRRVLTVEGERLKETDSTVNVVHLTFDCVCVWKNCSQNMAATQSNWSVSELPPDPLTNMNTCVSVSYKKNFVILTLVERRKLCHCDVSEWKTSTTWGKDLYFHKSIRKISADS